MNATEILTPELTELGFTTREDDHVIELWHKDIKIGFFSATSWRTSKEVIQKYCHDYLKRAKKFQYPGFEEE